jgi:hypothetical protein
MQGLFDTALDGMLSQRSSSSVAADEISERNELHTHEHIVSICGSIMKHLPLTNIAAMQALTEAVLDIFQR